MTPQQTLYSESPMKSLPLELLQEIFTYAKEVAMSNGDTVFTEGERSDGTLYMVVDGELAVLFNRADGTIESKPKVRGELCGEAALVNKAQTRIATVQVV